MVDIKADVTVGWLAEIDGIVGLKGSVFAHYLTSVAVEGTVVGSLVSVIIMKAKAIPCKIMRNNKCLLCMKWYLN